eukprot:416280_1
MGASDSKQKLGECVIAAKNKLECKSASADNCTRLPKFINTINQYSGSIDTNDEHSTLNLDNYETVQILDIFLHLVTKHNNDQDFKYITNKLNEHDTDTCVMLRRNYRNRSRNVDYNHTQLYGDYSTNDIAKFQIFDKIHCFYHHPMNQEISHLTEKTAEKYNQFKHCMDVDDKNNIKMYSFGSEFVYGYKGEDKGDYKSYKPIYQKYESFKFEMTHNCFCKLTLQQFNAEYQKATQHLNSFYCKTNFINITIDHILCLMIYCNYDSLQRDFSTTYRKNISKHNEFFHLAKFLKMAVRKFGISIMDGNIKCFYHGIGEQLLLPETIGTDRCGVVIYCPLSTSSSLSVATNFCNQNNGLIVEFGGKQSSAKYFSM